ncbi:AbiH family protein [Sphingobacterium mizutaii]|uniref:AbiH family protein n=1 Tax=Sphingobacterium mizutaii TaxID=1010 RepID=UPI00289A2338|nr:AbiH family protein [Sphingobacterium mizutaii]
MNRLILIGNGFDLAHGLKTSYKDFIFWYLDECFNNAGIYANGYFYKDEFIRVEVLDHHRLMTLVLNAGEKGIGRYLYDKGELGNYLDYKYNQTYYSPRNIEKYNYVSQSQAHDILLESDFFKHLLYTCLDCGWVDIEQEYFNQLNKCKTTDGIFITEKLIRINSDMKFLTHKLEKYLSTEEKTTRNQVNDELVGLFDSGFLVNDLDTMIDGDEFIQNELMNISTDINNKKLYVLNFNYTNTFYPYAEQLLNFSKTFCDVEINHIHGQLNNPSNPIIFGFGDEHDKDYVQFEEKYNNVLFEHVKSYHYMKTSNYRNLIKFLNGGNYQVFVVGHSCGLSDRTMFKEIFDHENCKSVKILHHKRNDGKTDFFDKTINLGRHFSDKGRMRKLVVNFNEADAIPQMVKN